MKFQKLLPVLILALLLTSISGLAAASDDEIVAIVNGTEITLTEFYETLENEAGYYILSQMIVDELIRQKQVELGVYVDQQALNYVLADIMNQLGGEMGYYSYLEEMGISDALFRQQLEFELTLSMLAEAEIEVTPEEIIEFFQLYESYFDQPELVRASHILVETEENAEELLAQIKAGADFATLARENSIDPGSAANGGDLGYFPQGAMVPEFENLAWKLGINEFDKVKTSYGWHIILVKDKLDAEPANLDRQWDEVEQLLKEFLASDLNAYIQKLEAEAQIEVLRERYK